MLSAGITSIMLVLNVESRIDRSDTVFEDERVDKKRVSNDPDSFKRLVRLVKP